MKRLLLIACFSIILILSVSPVNGKPKDNNWQDYAYITYHRQSPLEVIETGNNFDVVLSLMKPQSCEELNAAGISCDTRQLKILERKGLIKRGPDGLWKTIVPMFDEEQTTLIREFSKSISGTIYASVRGDFKSFAGILKENGWEENAYSICFSYVLDDKMWNHIITPSQMASHHSWKGCIWYLYGRRSGLVPGTNQIGAFSQTWEESILSRIDYALLIDVANGLSFKGYPTVSGEVMGRAENAGLCDSEGKPLFPVIKEKEQKELVSLADAIGKGIADEMRRHVNECSLLSAVEGKGVAEVILSHELILDIMDQLEADGIIRRPTSLQATADKAPIGLSKLIYISY